MITEAEAEAALPANGFVRQYVEYAREQTTAPLVFHIGMALSLLAACTPISYGMLYAGTLRPNLYVALIGRSGDDQKSSALRLGHLLLHEAAPTLIGDQPGSPEGLIDSLSDKGTQVIFFSELGKMLAESRGGQMEPIRTLLTDLWDCVPTQRARAKKQGQRDVVSVSSPRLSLAAACSLPYLEKYTDGTDWTGGFLGRWLILYAKRERTNPMPKGRANPPEDLVNHLAIRSRIDTPGECLGLDDEAMALWVEWFHHMDKRPLPDAIAGLRTRVPGMALKIALLYAWDFGRAPFGEPWHMGLDVLYPALQLAELHIRSVTALAETISPHNDARLRREVLALFEDRVPHDIAHVLRVTKRKRRDIKECVAGLVEEGALCEGSAPGGGKTYWLRPV